MPASPASARTAGGVLRKSSGSISGPTDDIVRPAHVWLLDYEIELGLVIRRGPATGTVVADADLSSHVAGLVIEFRGLG
jgi:2-keto-4-pentenoate hydratase/2-oxohepta-3-ene-1,7-dioic acid hydratase in catechol pathway